MSATKAFDLVVDAYIEVSGQTKAQAKAEVAEKLAQAWALEAFGSGVASRVATATEPEAATEEGEE